jgi:hypothetical protein
LIWFNRIQVKEEEIKRVKTNVRIAEGEVVDVESRIKILENQKGTVKEIKGVYCP